MAQVVQHAPVLNTRVEEYAMPAQAPSLIVHHALLTLFAHYARIRSLFSQQPIALAIAASTLVEEPVWPAPAPSVIARAVAMLRPVLAARALSLCFLLLIAAAIQLLFSTQQPHNVSLVLKSLPIA